MYRTYKPEYPEETLIPKEVTEIPVGICSSPLKKPAPLSVPGMGFLNTLHTDDIILIGILLLLFYENCEDNILITVIAVLLITGL